MATDQTLFSIELVTILVRAVAKKVTPIRFYLVPFLMLYL